MLDSCQIKIKFIKKNQTRSYQCHEIIFNTKYDN